MSQAPDLHSALGAHVPLVVSQRGDTVKNIHYGSIAVVDRTGRLCAWAGDPSFVTFTRSALKAFQVLRALGLAFEDEPHLAPYAGIPLLNMAGLSVGVLRPVFSLQRA